MTLLASLRTDPFAFFQEFVRLRSAIVVGDDKRYLVETRLEPVARAAGLSGLEELADSVRRGDVALERSVVDAMTTNETSWFRDRTPFDALRDVVLPERIAANGARRHLAIWSAACSTGQEPYSVALLLEQAFPETASWSIDILATDLSSAALERARKGRYTTLEVNRGLPAASLTRHFVRDGAHFQIADALRNKVRFREMNLAAPFPPFPPQDVILLRNVLIYFDAPTKRRILAACRAQLRPGGYLLLGAAETTRDLVEGFSLVPAGRATLYRLEEA